MAWTTPRWLQSVLRANATPAAADAPRFLDEGALGDPPTALDLVARELAWLAERLPTYLDEVREETRPQVSTTAAALHRSSVQVLQQVDRHLAALADRESPPQRARAAELAGRGQLLRSLSDTVRELTEVIGRAGTSGEVATLSASIAEALHVILLTAVDAIREPEADNIGLLGQLTGDRSAVMERIRQGLVRGERTLTVDEHHVLFTSTALFERIIRLLRRFQEGLGRERR
jgi:phosphate:Na+ symporter